MRTRGSTPLEEGMTGLADSEAMELHRPESNGIAVSLLWKPLQQDAAASVDQPGVTR
jgi:hypothetical protein